MESGEGEGEIGKGGEGGGDDAEIGKGGEGDDDGEGGGDDAEIGKGGEVEGGEEKKRALDDKVGLITYRAE